MARERHPIADDAPAPTIESLVLHVHRLNCHLAQLWDQVWWMHLPWYRRLYYRVAERQRDPIRQFYFPYEDVNTRGR